MIEFIYGLPTSGKTTLLYDKIKQELTNGGEAVLIVPDQEALEAEAAVISHCGGVPVLKLRVYGFSRLADDVFRRYGGISYDYPDKSGQLLAVFLAICSVMPALKVYGSTSPSDSALLSSVLSAIREMKRQGVTAAELAAASEAPVSQRLKDKLNDMALIYPAYCDIMSREGSDPDDALQRMFTVLSEKGGMPECSVYFDSFVSFTGVQMKITELFMRTCKNTVITFGLPCPSVKNTPAILSPVETSEKRLRAAAMRCGGVKDTVLGAVYARPHIAELEKGLRLGTKSTLPPDDAIRMIRARTPFEEAELVAADIRKRLQGGCRCREIAVLTQNASAWRGIIDAAFERYGIPHFISVREDARQKAIFRLILSALYICINDFRTKDVSSYVKTGLLDLSSDDLDVFDDYITRRQIHGCRNFEDDFTGAADSYGAPADESAAQLLQRINETRAAVITPLYDLYNELKSCSDAKQISSAVVRLLQRINVTETLQTLKRQASAFGDEAEAEQISQLWSVFVSATTQLCRVCGDLPLNVYQYAQLLQTVLSETDIGKIPTSTDQVTVGDSGMLRVHGIKHAYLIGCCEGDFPSASTDAGLFDDGDREELLTAGVELPESAESQNDRHIYDFYRCASLPSLSVTFSYSTGSTSGKEKYPSHMLRAVQRIFPDITPVTSLTAEDVAASKESSFEYFALNRGTREGEIFRRIISDDPAAAEKASLLDVPIVSDGESLSPETVAAIMPGTVRLSPTRITAFSDCAFGHCCSYFLKLRRSDEISFGKGEFGSFVHEILRRLIRDCIKDPGLLDADDKTLTTLIDGYINDYCRYVLKTDPNADGMGRFRARLKQLKKCAVTVAIDVLNELRTGKFRPVEAELEINEKKGLPPYVLHLPDGRTTYLTGQIDRVDAYEKDGVTYIKLVDYKTGDFTFNTSDISGSGKSIQLFAYMLSVCTPNGKFEDPVPAALFYMDAAPGMPSEKESGSQPVTGPLTRGGVALAEQTVLDALEPGLDVNTGGNIFKKTAGNMTFTVPEKMQSLFEETKEAIKQTAENICSGGAPVVRSLKKNEKSPCRKCPYITICRNTKMKGDR